jgi:hypothetical protein
MSPPPDRITCGRPLQEVERLMRVSGGNRDDAERPHHLTEELTGRARTRNGTSLVTTRGSLRAGLGGRRWPNSDGVTLNAIGGPASRRFSRGCATNWSRVTLSATRNRRNEIPKGGSTVRVLIPALSWRTLWHPDAPTGHAGSAARLSSAEAIIRYFTLAFVRSRK